MTSIHPTALVDPSAELADDVVVGPYTTIEAGVRVGAGSRIGGYATLGCGLTLGREVQVFNYACLGTASQDRKHTGEPSRAEIGDRTVVREFVTVNRATRPDGVTRIGSDCLLMAYAHVAHECVIGDGVVLVNAVTVGGEVTIEDEVNLGGHACIHQYCRVGRNSIVGANSKVTQDIPPYLLADGHPARPYGPNVVGLRRKGFTEGEILEIRRIYRELFARGRRLSEALAIIERDFEGERARRIADFCRSSERGIARPRGRSADESDEEIQTIALQPATADR
jgi:UDP-N-acetylglucosamine acyltransferase